MRRARVISLCAAVAWVICSVWGPAWGQERVESALVDAGAPFGKLILVDEIDCGSKEGGHGFVEDPPGASRIETILGKRCRVLRKTEGEGAYFSYRIGKGKRLKAGGAYVLSVAYPEDTPRSMVVQNGGNESSCGFHTGSTVGDALHTKYGNVLSESLKLPLSGEYETWRMYFNLHDRFPDLKFIRGKGERKLLPEDGFTVTIAQFSARDIPASSGAAVCRIRLYAVPDVEGLRARYTPVPEGLPRRHLFWREEMSDGCVASLKENERGVREVLAWYRYKAGLMHFLGMNTYCKDLLEFGACQHWDPSEGGGNNWVHYNRDHKGRWGRIVELMGREGFSVLPYYEYAGSLGGKDCLGYKRRSRPLTRPDAYTHIRWVEKANADITDPDTYADFKKMLDLTVVRHKEKAAFAGVWLRPRGQLPMSFADATLGRFAREANGGKAVTREALTADEALLERYRGWWFGKRREFLSAMREHLRQRGVNDEAAVLYTAILGEGGPRFATWENFLVTDDVTGWKEILARPEHVVNGRGITAVGIDEVIRRGMYAKALTAYPLNWGKWEVHHGNPPADPARYKGTPGVLMTHAFSRAYTVGSAATFEEFRGPAGLAIVRHYPLNENMMFDRQGKAKLGYFVADIERAGPYCMLAEVRAMAYGDPRYIGYLCGLNFNRGFPEYARDFNCAFLSLPALPSEVLEGAANDAEVVVRRIATKKHGTYLAVMNIGVDAIEDVAITPGVKGKVTDAVSGEALAVKGGKVHLKMRPCQLRALHVE